MYLKSVSSFVEYLSIKGLTPEEILRYLVMRVLSPIHASSATIHRLNSDNTIVGIANFGLIKAHYEQYPRILHLKDELPFTQAIKERQIVWVTTLPKWPAKYGMLQDSPYHSGEKTFIALPIEKNGTPIAALGIFCTEIVHSEPEIEIFLEAIANIIALCLFPNPGSISGFGERNVMDKKSNSENILQPLTVRQLLILSHMSHGLTNLAISNLLAFSESTIRQETIKIFSILNCNGRGEATQMYLNSVEGKTETA